MRVFFLLGVKLLHMPAAVLLLCCCVFAVGEATAAQRIRVEGLELKCGECGLCSLRSGGLRKQ